MLEEFEDRLRSQGAPIVDVLRPGLTDDEMQQLVGPLGLRLPREARCWWAWHDGTVVGAPMIARYLGPGWMALSLDDAVRDCVSSREIEAEAREIEEAAGEDREDWWRHGWLPLVHPGGGSFAIDTGVGEDEPVPVYRYHSDTQPGAPDLASIGDLVTIWIDALDSGAWQWEPNDGRWIYDDALLDPRVSRLGLA
jgi:cell wall assembly regulator SMI1